MSTPPFAYPFGYGAAPSPLTFEQLVEHSTVNRLHPEMRRRVFALMQYAGTVGVPLGIGTGWRIQPDPPPPGFADPGNSNHEGFPAGPDSTGAVACDMVPAASWPWMETNAAAFGLRTFNRPSSWGYSGSSEPWHIQPVEIPASRSWRTEPWTLPAWPLMPSFRPAAGEYSLWPLGDKPSIGRGSTGDPVRYAKGVMYREIRAHANGLIRLPGTPISRRRQLRRFVRLARELEPNRPNFGWRMGRTVRAMQTAFDMTVDGRIGNGEGWPFIDRLSDGLW